MKNANDQISSILWGASRKGNTVKNKKNKLKVQNK